MTIQLDKSLSAASYSPILTLSNPSPLKDRTPRKAKTRRNRDSETQRGWTGVGLCFPRRRKLLVKYKKLADQLPDWL